MEPNLKPGKFHLVTASERMLAIMILHDGTWLFEEGGFIERTLHFRRLLFGEQLFPVAVKQ